MQVRAQIVSRAALVAPRMEQEPPWLERGAGAQPTVLRVAPPRSGEPDNLARWSAGVRAASIQQALQSSFHVEYDAAAQTVWGIHLDKPAGGMRQGAGVRTVSVFSLRKPGEADFEAQLQWVFQAATDQRKDRFEEVLAQMEFPWPLWVAALNLQPGRHRHTIEMIGQALGFATAVYHRSKQELACLRPADRSPLVQPIIATPEHGSLPSGHATESYLVATLLPALLGQSPHSPLAIYLDRLAAQIAHNRVIAGVHFPVDSQAGRALGIALARYLLRRAGREAGEGIAWSGVGFGASEFRPAEDLLAVEQPEAPGEVRVEPLWAWLWKRAADEWTS